MPTAERARWPVKPRARRRHSPPTTSPDSATPSLAGTPRPTDLAPPTPTARSTHSTRAPFYTRSGRLYGSDTDSRYLRGLPAGVQRQGSPLVNSVHLALV